MKLGLSKTDYPFDYFFEKASNERTAIEDCDEDCDVIDDDALSSDSDSELTASFAAVSSSDSPHHLSVDVTVTE